LERFKKSRKRISVRELALKKTMLIGEEAVLE